MVIRSLAIATMMTSNFAWAEEFCDGPPPPVQITTCVKAYGKSCPENPLPPGGKSYCSAANALNDAALECYAAGSGSLYCYAYPLSYTSSFTYQWTAFRNGVFDFSWPMADTILLSCNHETTFQVSVTISHPSTNEQRTFTKQALCRTGEAL
jgi:hypothetical protein